MQNFAPEIFQSELLPDEQLLWTGQPSRQVWFHASDIFLIPMSLLWGGFAIFWEAAVLGLWNFGHANPERNPMQWVMSLWGIPFVVVGQYLIWGRFIWTWWKKARVWYAVTNRRVIVLETAPSRKVVSARHEAIPQIEKSIRNDGIGNLTFGSLPLGRSGRGFAGWSSVGVAPVPMFNDIEDAESVYRLALGARDDEKSVFRN